MNGAQKVAVFFTGGTIGMERGPDGAVRPAVQLGELLAELVVNKPMQKKHGAVAWGDTPPSFFGTTVPAGTNLCDVLLTVDWANLPSPHMTPQLMFRLAQDVKKMLARPDIAGAVVAHGTDVLEETAFMCDLLVPPDKPLVLTGAMRAHGEAGYDGLRNLAQAIQVCCTPSPQGLGAVILMADHLYAPLEATKVHSMAVNSFAAPGLGPVGACVAGRVQYFRVPVAHKTFFVEDVETRVDIISLAPGMDGKFLACSRTSGAKGMVVEAFGAGNVPPTVLEEIQRALKAGLPVVVTSRCIEGGVWPLYGYSGGANQLAAEGVLLGGCLTASKARIVLMLALAETSRLGVDQRLLALQKIFATYQ